MYLLDLVAQRRTATVRTAAGQPLPDAGRFNSAVRDCPIRYVLTDGLARCATEMAYADGDRLTSCLDLIRVPARSMWIEWTDSARRLETLAISEGAVHDAGAAFRAGVLLQAAANGRSGILRSFWSSRNEVAYCSPLSASFDFDGVPDDQNAPDPVAGRGSATVTAPDEFGLKEFLEHLSFRFDEEWGAYYREASADESMRHAVLRANLGACAFDPPMVFAFLLMLSARGALPRRAIDTVRLNRARQRSTKPALLPHVLVSAPLYTSGDEGDPAVDNYERRGPRLHHVCGHIVRRGSAVFWRVPHLRGSARLGQIRTRTVALSFAAEPA